MAFYSVDKIIADIRHPGHPGFLMEQRYPSKTDWFISTCPLRRHSNGKEDMSIL
ncbi:hypothetical protein HanIR_Chr03g0104911 [Helianthus annuus]|nr:hypothetical protein HanIR_Chr03g0104911 [Helianthus annuus]